MKLSTSLCLSLALIALASAAFAQDEVQPPTATISVTTGKTTAVVTWTAVGDACTNATLAQYDVRYSTSSITECNFTSATQLPSIPTPGSPGTAECAGFLAAGTLSCNTTYYFGWKVRDAAGNWSDLVTTSKATSSCNQSAEVLCE